MVDKLEKVKAEIERCINRCNAKIKSCPVNTQVEAVCLNKISAYKDVLSFIDSLEKEPINTSIDFEQELYKNFGQVKDFTLAAKIAKKFYEMGKLSNVESNVKNWKEEPVSDDSVKCTSKIILEGTNFNKSWYAHPELAFKAGAKWQKENLWKPADGDDLPEYEREVVAFQETFPTDVDVPSLLKIVIAHRPNPEGYDGKSITTGEVEHYTPKTYDKGGWNIPDVKWWLDCSMPKEIEQ